jgi:hypothetical protein
MMMAYEEISVPGDLELSLLTIKDGFFSDPVRIQLFLSATYKSELGTYECGGLLRNSTAAKINYVHQHGPAQPSLAYELARSSRQQNGLYDIPLIMAANTGNLDLEEAVFEVIRQYAASGVELLNQRLKEAAYLADKALALRC